MHFCC